ncbi:hypothetical protein C6V83_14560 [Gordonia iterans]|uniref:YdbS-like PH domain-containing protein n=1 Tax=Gordonia iterans TaxID=1004901 RepID=A0A2S0KHW4_9ACTN|nr:PH domain-containing protein [Gordonia iterans]AVM01282.1 hypothetical protein C6V83_14560 [Gordonia iterans]
MTASGTYLGAGRQRVHPLTPVLKAWKGLTALIVVLVVNFGTGVVTGAAAVAGAAGDTPLVTVALGSAGVVVLIVLVGAVSMWSWSKRFFELDAEELRIGHGILFRQRRTARYDRVQSVDIRQPLIPRLLGLGELTVETAGGADSALVISYLKVPELERLRAEILAATRTRPVPGGAAAPRPAPGRAPSGLSASELSASELSAPGPAASGPTASGPTASGPAVAEPPAPGRVAPGMPYPMPDAEPGRILAGPVPARMLFGMIALSFGFGALTVIAGAAVAWFAGGGVVGAVIALGGLFGLIWVPLDRFWRQTLTLNEESRRLKITAGLASTRKQTVPLHRIHALRVRRPFLWRGPGWAELNSSIAGYGASDEQSGDTVLVAVGTDASVEANAATVLDRIGAADRTPIRHWRSPERAKWLSPIDWSRQSVSLSQAGISATWGRLSEKASVVPWRHVQGAALTQGPLQRRLGIAHVQAAVVAGPAQVVARDLAVDDARALLAEILEDRRAGRLR